MKHFCLEVCFCRREHSKEPGTSSSLYANCFFEWNAMWQISGQVSPQRAPISCLSVFFCKWGNIGMKKEKVFKALIIENITADFFVDCFNTEAVFNIRIPQQQSLIKMQSLALLQNLKINTTTYFLLHLLQMMRLTFRIMSRGKPRRTWDTILRSNTTNHFFFSNCNHVRPQVTKGPDHNKTRAQGSCISLGPGSTEWTCPILNMGECLLITRENGRSQAWQGKLQINIWDLQHVKWAQTGATGGEVSWCSM